jgi:hypothetical protein|uniref:Uncharacterized protein n=1 Tax=viral metagenome TaxID=1070528 RepID=A0A6C0EDL4_9ZZZZ
MSKDNNFENNFKTKKVIRKSGKTLLVKSFDNFELNETLFDNLEGLQDKFIKKDKFSAFLKFDTPQNSLNGLKTLKEKSSNLKFKFSYYKVFFTVNGLSDISEYNNVKKEIMEYVSSKTDSNVLYCKLYTKNDKYLGCGDLTMDTLDGMMKLLSKDSNIKEFTINSYTGCFYKFNDNKNKKND